MGSSLRNYFKPQKNRTLQSPFLAPCLHHIIIGLCPISAKFELMKQNHQQIVPSQLALRTVTLIQLTTAVVQFSVI